MSRGSPGPDDPSVDPLAATQVPASSGAASDRSDMAATTPSSDQKPSVKLDLSALPEGAAVGRYVVLERAGQGALGVVYKAYDRELNRFVAIKLLRVRSRTREQAEETRLRLLREAQALARLDHPNVVPVYDVGIHKSDVFLAMGFVEGITLEAWLKLRKRATAEILGVFLAAGEGLAAAHKAGLVHRDFKPENVLVGSDGSVRVLDFGLARPVEREGASAPQLMLGVSLASGSSDALPLHSDLTHEGARIGTPLYMAPEQHVGGAVDARADQFAFCVALHEALYRQHPFDAGGTVRDLVVAVTSGKLRPPPRGASVPRHVALALRRGLGRDAGQRFASMSSLLEALRRRRGNALRGLGIALVLVAVAATAGGVAFARYQRSLLCAGAETKLAGVWDDTRRTEMSTAFTATSLPFARDAFQHAESALDAYARSWVDMHRDACEATHVRREQSAELLDLRVECLRERLEDLRAQTDVLAHADKAAVENAVQAARALPRLETCADAAALRAPIRPASDKGTRARVEAVRTELAQARARQHAESYPLAISLASKATEEATALGYRPVEAEALYVLADLQDDQGDYAAAERTFRRSLAAALAGRHDGQATSTLIALVAEVGLRQARFAEGHEWAALAQAEVERTGDAFAGGKLARNEARLFVREEKYEAARASIERCLSVWEPVLGGDDTLVAGALTDLGNVFFMQGRYPEALARYTRSLAITEKANGSESPSLAPNLNNLGEVYLLRGEYDLAEKNLERARSLWEHALGPDHPKVALALGNLAETDLGRGDVEGALARAQRTVAIWQKAVSPDHPDVAAGLHIRAEVLRAKGDYPASLADEERARAIREKVFGPSSGNVAESLGSLGKTHLAAGHVTEAASVLERALAIAAGTTTTPLELADLRFDLARALATSDAGRSRSLAEQARAGYRGITSPIAVTRAAGVEAWLASHGGNP